MGAINILCLSKVGADADTQGKWSHPVITNDVPASRPRSVDIAFGDVAPVLPALIQSLPARPIFIYERTSTRTRQIEKVYVGFGEVEGIPYSTDAVADLRSSIVNAFSSSRASTAVLAFMSYEALRPRSLQCEGQTLVPSYTIVRPTLLLELDYRRRTARLSGDYEAAIDSVRAALLTPAPRDQEKTTIDPGIDTMKRWSIRPSKNEFLRAVAEVQREIRARQDLDGVCLSVELESQAKIDSLENYLVLREMNPSTCMFFLEQGQFSLWGATSLPILQVRDGRIVVETDGATRRVEPGAADQWNPTDKELAEYHLVVAALRDDLDGVVVPASLTFTSEREQRTYFNLRHLFAEAVGDLAEGVDAVAALKRLTPHGAAAGYHKAVALELIDQFDVAPRGPYSGVIGIFDHNGDADAACVIRSTWKAGTTIRTRAGAKIVAASDPVAEYEESILKTLPLRRTVELILRRVPTSVAG
jgi:anthranilate synthase component I